MAAYIIVTRVKTTDPEQLAIYRSKVPEAMVGHAYRRHAAYGRQRVLEGEDSEASLVIEFPSFEAAEAWYDSPTYQEVVKHRLAGAVHRSVIVEGVPLDQVEPG